MMRSSMMYRIRAAGRLMVLAGLLAGTLVSGSQAQDQAEEAPTGWAVDLVTKLAASQAAYDNWQEGGLNTLAFTTGADGKATRTSQRWTQTHQMRLSFGLVKQDTLDFRKADDLIQINSSLQYRGDDFFKRFQPTISASMRTQFASGFNYKRNPFTEPPKSGDAPPVKVSEFFSPATFTQGLGLTYNPQPWIKSRLGLGAKETVVVIDRLRVLYGVDPGRAVRVEAGLESRTEFDREIAENIRLQSTLSLFAAFNQPDLPDLIWENLVTMKVNSWMNVNLEFVTLYDRDLSKRVQLKEVLSLGVSFVLI